MVVIEPVMTPSIEHEQKIKTSTIPETTELSGYNSDGYETASETELNDAENGNSDVNDSEQKDDLGSVEDQHLDRPKDAVGSVEGQHLDQPKDAVGGMEGQHLDQPKDAVGSVEDQHIDQPKDNQLALDQANDAKLEGNTLFKEGRYEEALLKYELALQLVQDMASATEIRAMCHANRAACFSKLENYKETVKECTKALELNPSYTKAFIRRGEAHEKLENYEDSMADMTKILELDPSYDQARRNIIRLKPLADEKREKMKEEMIGKLKEMGNSILGRFGMSVDNFKTVKDPNTGSYSLSFQR